MKEPTSKCYFYTLNYISRYPKTEEELRIKLLEKWFISKEIDNTVDFMKYRWYVDDRNFASMYLNSEVIRKWKPLFMVQQKLFQKWINKDIIDELKTEYESDLQIWMKEKISREIRKMKQKDIDWFDIIQKLMRRWYHIDMIKEVIHERKYKESNEGIQ